MTTTTPWQRLRRSAGSLKLRIALAGALLIGASVAVTVWWVLHEVARHTEKIALEAQERYAERIARTTSGQLVRLQLALRGAARVFPVAQARDSAAMAGYLADLPVLTAIFSSSFVVDADGRMIALSDEAGTRQPSVDVADRAYFQRTVTLRRPTVTTVETSRISGEPIVVFAMPILDMRGQVVAVLGASLKLRSRGLLGIVSDDGEGSPALTVVTDTQGRILAHPDPAWLLRNIADEPRMAGAVQRWVAQGRPVEPSGDSVDSGEHLIALAGVPDADWVVFRSVPQSALLGSLVKGRARAGEVGLLVALLGGTTLLLTTGLLLAPLRRLEQRALRLRDHNLADDAGWPDAGGEIGRLSAVFRNVMQERRMGDQAQSDLLQRLQAIMAYAPVGICFTRDKKFELVSTRFNHLLGYDDPGLTGQSPRVIYGSDAFYAELGERVAAAFGERQPFDEEIEFMRRDGSRFWGRLQGTPVRAGDAAAGTIWILDDVTRTRRQREELSWSSSHDSLTELINRPEFERRLRAVVGNRRRFPVSALFIDLDHFKVINDSAGHAAGDRVLVDIARLFMAQVREDDTVARLGGDEFAVVLQGCEGDNAARVAEKMLAAVQAYRLPWKGHNLSLGASFGVVELDATLPTLEAVMAAADSACYEAKRAGRNTIRIHDAQGAVAAPNAAYSTLTALTDVAELTDA
jgi:diguanylate cyclase (GGDEF)-like protein/PAS domain S-box-containing protein